MSIEANLSGAFRKLKKTNKALDANILMPLLGNRYLKWVDDNFRQQGTERKWRPLSPNTVAARKRGGSQPLQDTGRLRQSFRVTRPRKNEIRIRSPLRYAAHHEHGTGPFTIRPKRGKTLRFVTASGTVFARFVKHPGVPQRKMLPSLDEAERVGVRTLTKAIEKGLR